MSIQEVERVMQRALRDDAFRELLQRNPDVALSPYALTPEERALILGVPPPGAASAPPPEEPSP